jgi:protocatechuate 3,4-dioxygenase beta subunit
MLAAGLLAGMAPTGQAFGAGSGTARGRDTPARLDTALEHATGISAARTVWHSGVISGVVRSVTKASADGACVAAVSHRTFAYARTGPDGRYVLGGLRPGQYKIRVSACASATRSSGDPAISAYWSLGPASVTVRAGQISNPAPISFWHLDLSSLAASARQALPASATSASRGSISGLVTGNGRPLRGVCAVAFSAATGGGALAVTARTGRYRITRLRPGRYEVVFVAGVGGCPNKGNWLLQWHPGVNSLFPNRKVKAVRVRAGKDIAGIDGHLKKGGEISGTVRAGSGKALPGICADVTGAFYGGFLQVDFNVATGKAGRYAARGLFPGRHQVEFMIGCGDKGNYAPQWWRDTPSQAHARTIRITGTRHVSGVNATLLPGATISGVVKAVNPADKPLAGVCVIPTDDAGHSFVVARTRRDGGYRLRGLSAGNFTIIFDPGCLTGISRYLEAERSIRLTARERVMGFNAHLQSLGAISGVVTDTRGRPLGGVCVEVDDDSGDMTWTLPNGHYTLFGSENGSFQVQFVGGCGNTGSLAPQFYPDSPSSLFAKLVRFRQNTITPRIDATMQPGGTLVGRVTDAAGHRLSRICVTASTSQFPELAFADSQNGGSAFAENGKYAIRDLAPGAYDLSFGCGGYGMESFPSRVNPVAADLLSVNAGTTTTVPGVRLSHAGTITGTVTNEAGKPLPFTCVAVGPRGSRKAFFPVAFGFSGGPNGRYRLSGLAPARYLVQFINCAGQGNLASQWYRRAPAEVAATAVRVRPGRTDAGINAVMTAGGTISGLVTGPTGKPANDICVTPASQQNQTIVSSKTGKSGRYRLTGLSTGRWSLKFTPCGSSKPDLASVTRPGTVRVTAPYTVTGVNIKLPLGGSVSGLITSQARGKPLRDVCVLLLPVKASGGTGFALTDGHGRYVISHLKAGDYRAYIADPNCDRFPDAVPPFAPQWYANRPSQAAATIVHVSAGSATTGINGALTPFGAVTGVVDTPAHAPLAGECVTAVPFRAPPDPEGGLAAQHEVAVTGRAGVYTLTALMPGRYKIEFGSGCGGRRFANQWWDNAGSAKSAKVITVGFAMVTGINATVRK